MKKNGGALHPPVFCIIKAVVGMTSDKIAEEVRMQMAAIGRRVAEQAMEEYLEKWEEFED